MMPRRKHKKKSGPKSALQKAREKAQATKAEKRRKRASAIDHRFLHSAPDDVYTRPTSGGQQHSPRKVTDDGVQKYEKSLVSRQAIETCIRKGQLKPNSQPVTRQSGGPAHLNSEPQRPNQPLCLWLWRDSRESLRRLLTFSDEVPEPAIGLAKGIWILELHLRRGIDRKREKYVNAARAIAELDRKGYYDFRIEVKGGSQKVPSP